MDDFTPAFAEFTGDLAVALPVGQAFELFSPIGETRWVPGWAPELLHPPGATWEQGLIFRTREMYADAVWLVTALDLAAHDVEYHRVEPGRYVARVRVRCNPTAGSRTHVTVRYAFVGLSVEGNAEIAAMTRAEYSEKMNRWERWIGERAAPG